MSTDPMKFVCQSDDEPDAHLIYSCIKSFMESDQSGPHAPEGWILSHLLNYCSDNNIPFTLCHMPDGYFYVKKGGDTEFIPEQIKTTLGIQSDG